MIRRALLALSLLAPAPALADTLLDNINGISVDRDGAATRFAGLVFDDEGRVTHVLKFGDKPPKVDYREDGHGHVVIPGLIDAHVHVMSLGLSLLTLDLSGTRSLEEAQARIAAYAAEHPDRPWIIGRGWNQELWGLGRFPTAAELDAAVPDRPVWLERVDGHAGWANSVALREAGITAKTADPAGGRIERLPGGKVPAGVLVDAATALIDRLVPPPRPEDRDLALVKAQELLVSKGVTAVADMGTSIEDWMTFRRAGDEGRLQIRIMSYASDVPTMQLIGGPRPTAWLYDDRLRLNGLKLYLDGALGSRGAWLKAPYADDPGNTGLQLLNGTQLRNLMSRAAIDHFQVAVHAIGDAANAEVLDAIDELSVTYDGDRRWRIEHAQIVDPADIARFAAHGIDRLDAARPPDQRPADGRGAARAGPARRRLCVALAAAGRRAAGVRFGCAGRGARPARRASRWRSAAPMRRASRSAAGMPEETVTRETALAAYTAGAAYAGFAEGRFGELKVGRAGRFPVARPRSAAVQPGRPRAATRCCRPGSAACGFTSDRPHRRAGRDPGATR